MYIRPRYITITVLVLIVGTVSFSIFKKCSPDPTEIIVPDIPVTEQYELPESHSDNIHELKSGFFNEPFTDFDGDSIALAELAGLPLIIAVYPSFLTDDGRNCLLGLEALLRDHPGIFHAVVIPVENREIIEPAIEIETGEFLHFLFASDENSNLSLLDEYENFFWDENLIAVDFPDPSDPMAGHLTGPFYWVVDEDGVIREKLIDYSDERGVDIRDVEMVLEALLLEMDGGRE